ncbi:MAG: response regulator [Anaerolineales bacterium]|nr:response regulator [Anaerolineales bacterium]
MPKPTALIIEDDPQLSQVFSIALLTDFAVEVLTDGDAALARLALAPPAVIVLDLNLPGASGKTILEQIRADERLKAIPVILATADVRQAEYLQEAADIVLVKPISPVQLRAIAMRLHQTD